MFQAPGGRAWRARKALVRVITGAHGRWLSSGLPCAHGGRRAQHLRCSLREANKWKIGWIKLWLQQRQWKSKIPCFRYTLRKSQCQGYDLFSALIPNYFKLTLDKNTTMRQKTAFIEVTRLVRGELVHERELGART